jgi:hypothetical protein
VDERCAELEKAGIIEECDSDFAANSVMAAKKDPAGNWKLARFCTDLRRVNEQTAQDRYPMPLPEDVLEGLGHAKFYSSIDIRGASFAPPAGGAKGGPQEARLLVQQQAGLLEAVPLWSAKRKRLISEGNRPSAAGV